MVLRSLMTMRMVINVHTYLHCEHILLLMHCHVPCMVFHVMPWVWHCLYKSNVHIAQMICIGYVLYEHLVKKVQWLKWEAGKVFCSSERICTVHSFTVGRIVTQ